MSSVLIRKGSSDTKACPAGHHVKRQWGQGNAWTTSQGATRVPANHQKPGERHDSSVLLSGGTTPPLALRIQASEQQDHQFLLLKPPNWWYLVMTVIQNEGYEELFCSTGKCSWHESNTIKNKTPWPSSLGPGLCAFTERGVQGHPRQCYLGIVPSWEQPKCVARETQGAPVWNTTQPQKRTSNICTH